MTSKYSFSLLYNNYSGKSICIPNNKGYRPFMTGTPLALPDSSTVTRPEQIVHQKESGSPSPTAPKTSYRAARNREMDERNDEWST